jgi:Beta-propeller repeat
LWTNGYPTPSGSGQGSAIATDQVGNAYVTGYSPGTGTSNDIVTIAYDHNGNQLWLQRYNGPANGDDRGVAIAADHSGNVYVSGYETTTEGGTEMVLIKYAPVTPPPQDRGTVVQRKESPPGQLNITTQ